MKNKTSFFFMYFSFFIYSLSSIFSKLASTKDFMSVGYILCFAGIILILGVYALLWQQVLKKIPLSIAMANKPVVLIFGLIWACLLFKEAITFKILLGMGLVFIGIFIIGFDSEDKNEK